MTAAAAAQLEGFAGGPAGTVTTGDGLVAPHRRVSYRRGGEAAEGRLLCLVEGRVALAIDLPWAAATDGADSGAAGGELEGVLPGVRLLARPTPQRPATLGGDAGGVREGARVDPPAAGWVAASWGGPGGVWAVSPPHAAALGQPTRWSPAE